MKTLIIVSHPYKEQSSIIKALQQTAEAQDNVEVRNLETLYGNNISGFDISREQASYNGVDRVVFIYPIHWFNLTPMLKAYLNEVWTYGWAFGPEGDALKDKELLVVTSAGASEHTYSHQGLIQSTIGEVLTPMKATALYVGMKYLEPVSFHNVMGADGEKIAEFQDVLSDRLKL
ncbi:NAD(P)H-dependent oxidoreductase [Dickeya solani]|uniref:General stress protein (GSP14) n=1 Tax=Dickeya solani D s0432-1 TaxID=1231725 RepID=A0AAV3K7J6_9GAMM|nr:NAD(P)H-dependent oxidoreductase [Dickeya solani]ANE74565.1 NAD(P)H dehydrogenase [Dickeya solani IPO 2222]AUC41835.1 NAD(P)H oxidoreductase YRKL Putative NADPH-quinone reductase [Dickeya solani RNS 08.23.3.1.A]AUH10020.1 NAD(P)H dehydrogenase [Dickeya solani D s0432-1]AUH13974.1 NAD(P)H dehydrogenase [Dickeya solani]AYQ49054.1 General stress protein 14 [Dickeya solani]